jgi:hypothetical protein
MDACDDSDEEQEFDAPVLHKKQRMILFTFFASIRTRSCYLMKHWAQVESLGFFFRGCHQPGRKSFTGAFIQGLVTSWKDQESIYETTISSFNEKLWSTPMMSAAFDNFQKVIPKKNITGFKGAVVHVGTSMVMKRNKPIQVVVGTSFVSEFGVGFKVISVDWHDSYHFLLKGEVDELWNGAAIPPSALNADRIGADIELIVNGFLWPRIGWDITFMPGFQPRQEVTHQNEIVPPPHRAWVDATATNEDILFSKKSRFRTHIDEGACSLSTDRMALLHVMSKRISELGEYSSSIRDNADKRSVDLVSGMTAASQILYSVKNFEMRLIKHVNPHAGSVDECFTAPVIHHDETSRKGMMKTFLELAKHMQLLTYEMDGEMIGKGKLLPNALKRVVNLQVDALSSQNYRSLLLHFTKKLTELSSSSHVIDIIKALKRTTCQHSVSFLVK